MGVYQNIFMILLCIALFFILSYDKDTRFDSKKYMPILLLLLLIYFVYQNLHIGFFLLLVIILYASSKKKEQLYEGYLQLKKKVTETFNSSRETFANYEITPYISSEEKIEKTVPIGDVSSSSQMAHLTLEKEKIEEKPIAPLPPPPENKKEKPFELDIREIKEMYENIKSQIQQMK
jgi:hypothetical protein